MGTSWMQLYDHYVTVLFACASLTAVPPLPPTNLQVSNISTRAATLTWQAPVVSFLNSLTAVSSYQVIATQSQFPNVSDIRVDVGAGVTSYTFPHTLEEYTVYACTIKAGNTFGLGSATQPVDLRTLQAGKYWHKWKTSDISYIKSLPQLHLHPHSQ